MFHNFNISYLIRELLCVPEQLTDISIDISFLHSPERPTLVSWLMEGVRSDNGVYMEGISTSYDLVIEVN